MRLAMLLAAACSLRAEFLRVELTLGGLECASCAQSVDRSLKRIRGVESAEFRTAGSVAIVQLAPGNKVDLARIRDAVKGIGYTPKSAKVTARGEAREQDGQWVFRPAGLEAGIALEGSAEELRKSQGAVVIVEGAIADAGAPLVVTSIRRE
jgi:copper chaperone CopZ